MSAQMDTFLHKCHSSYHNGEKVFGMPTVVNHSVMQKFYCSLFSARHLLLGVFMTAFRHGLTLKTSNMQYFKGVVVTYQLITFSTVASQQR